jgi:hypothetical protein
MMNRPEFLEHYQKRSNIEPRFTIKPKLGQRFRSKTLTAQINEALCKVLCHKTRGPIALLFVVLF